MTVCVLTGAYARPSRTHGAAIAVAGALAPGASVDEIALSDHRGGLLDPFGDPGWASLRERVSAADLLIVGSPAMKASFSGLLKLFLDGFGAGQLGGTPTVAVMTGAGPAHSLAVEYQLRPVLTEVGCRVLAPGLYLWGADLEDIAGSVDAWVRSWHPRG